MISKRTAVRRIPVAIVFTALVVRALQDVPESRLERCHATDDNRLPSTLLRPGWAAPRYLLFRYGHDGLFYELDRTTGQVGIARSPGSSPDRFTQLELPVRSMPSMNTIDLSEGEYQNALVDDFEVDGKGRFAVRLASEEALVFFDEAGQQTGKLKLHPMASGRLAIRRNGNLLLNLPNTGHLLVEVDREGQVVGSFGQLLRNQGKIHRLSEQESDSVLSPEWHIGTVLCSEDEKVWFIFHHLPLIQAYNANGQMYREFWVSTPSIEEESTRFSDGQPACDGSRFRRNGHLLPRFASGGLLFAKGFVVFLRTDRLLFMDTLNQRQLEFAFHQGSLIAPSEALSSRDQLFVRLDEQFWELVLPPVAEHRRLPVLSR